MVVNFLIALLCLGIVALLIEFTISVFFAWLVFCLISWILSWFGLQQYAWLVFIVFMLWGWIRRY